MCSDKLTINHSKSNKVHFRLTAVSKSNYTFSCGDKAIDTVPRYVYLGLLLSENMCYEKMAKHVSKAANRALDLLIVKGKVSVGFNFESFSKLYDTMVWSVMSGEQGSSPECINSIQLHAARYFMGVGK